MSARGPLKDELPARPEPRALDEVYHRVEATLQERDWRRASRPLWPWWIGASASVAAAALLIVFSSGPDRPAEEARPGPSAAPSADPTEGPLRIAGTEEAFAGVSGERRVELSDGSVLELAPRTTIRARENSSERARMVLVEGRATFDVRPGGPRLWSIDAGTFEIVVLGTRFTVERQRSFQRVSVERGMVRVRGEAVPDAARLLGPGEELRLPAEPPAAPVATTPAPAPRAAPAATWRTFAAEGDYDRAYERVAARGFDREVAGSRDVETLFALADTARLSGHPAEARRPLSRIVSDFEADPRSAVAAFTLGRLELESFGRRDEAARWFERALALGLSGSLRRAAELRLRELRAASQGGPPSAPHE